MKRKAKKANLSCCMIVRNEEQFLARCLVSVRPYVHEIVIVDTGSEDRTLDIASSYTDKIYIHQWDNDFSKHRNQSISYATGDWIFYIDADEELAPGAGEAILEGIASARRGENFLMVNITDVDQRGLPRASWNFPRVFRNGVGIHFEGIVHNQVVGPGIAIPCPAVIYHYGYYLDEEKMRSKRNRSILLLKKQLEEDPENVFALYNMANMHVGMKDYRCVIYYAERAIRLLKKNETVPSFYISLYSPLIHAYIKEGCLEEAQRHAEDSVRIFPRFLDGFYLLNEIAFLKGDWEGAIRAGRMALKLYRELEKNRASLGTVVSYYLNSKCHLALRTGASLLKIGRTREAEEMFHVGTKGHPDPAAAYRFIVANAEECGVKPLYERFLARGRELFPQDVVFNRLALRGAVEKGEATEKVIEIFELLERIDPQEDWAYRKAIFHLERACFREAEWDFTQLISQRPMDAGKFHAFRALARERLGDREGALRDHEKAVSLDPTLGHCWVRLGERSMEEGNWEEALRQLEMARDGGIDAPDLWLRLAILGIRLGDLSISLGPLDRLLVRLGLENKRLLESLEDLAQVFEEVARVLEDEGELALAAEAYGMAGELDPSRAESALEAARKLIVAGKPMAGVSYLASVLKTAPWSEELADRVDSLLRAAGLAG